MGVLIKRWVPVMKACIEYFNMSYDIDSIGLMECVFPED